MKHASLALAASFLLAACASEPAPPAVAPPPPPPVVSSPSPPAADADPAPATDGNVTVAWVHGMQVIVEHVPGAEFAVSRLVVRGGVRNWTAGDAGIENVALDAAAAGGTQALAKEQFARRLASLGATIGASARADFSTLAAESPTAAFDETFGLLADVFLRPAMPDGEIGLQREQSIAARRRELDDGDGRLRVLEQQTVFAKHPYSARELGTVESLSTLTPDAVRAHLSGLREASRLLLVVVGDVDAAHVLELARQAYGALPRGAYVEDALPPLRFDTSRMAGDAHALPTNYVGSFFVAPTWKDADYVPARVAIDVLSHRVWEEVRTKRNLSYAPWAVYRWWYARPYAGFYVSAVDPSATLRVMMDEARRLQNDLVPANELAGVKAQLRTRYEQSRESSEDEAARLVDGEIYAGDWRFSRRYGEAAAAVTPEQIREVARKYMTTWQTAIVGDPSKLDPAIVGVAGVASTR